MEYYRKSPKLTLLTLEEAMERLPVAVVTESRKIFGANATTLLSTQPYSPTALQPTTQPSTLHSLPYPILASARCSWYLVLLLRGNPVNFVCNGHAGGESNTFYGINDEPIYVLGERSRTPIFGRYPGFHLLTQATPTLGLKYLHPFTFDGTCEDSS